MEIPASVVAAVKGTNGVGPITKGKPMLGAERRSYRVPVEPMVAFLRRHNMTPATFSRHLTMSDSTVGNWIKEDGMPGWVEHVMRDYERERAPAAPAPVEIAADTRSEVLLTLEGGKVVDVAMLNDDTKLVNLKACEHRVELYGVTYALVPCAGA
jgi:hypothetical protein